MSLTILNKTNVGAMDASGNATVILKPDVGQNWAPLFVRVSTGSRNVPVAYCAVYHGSPGVSPQQTQFIDDTYLGNGDTSSMISGTPILFGEAIIFQFLKGTPGDTAIATVYGVTSDIPPNLDILPQVPGTHFQGHPTTEIAVQESFVASGSPTLVGAGNTLTLTANGSTPTDVRQFTSYYLKIFAIANAASPAAFNGSRVDFFWYGSQNTANGTIVFQDEAEWWSDGSTGTFALANGVLMLQDVHHGPYLRIIYTNESAESMLVNYILQWTTRPLPAPFARQQGGIDGTLAHTINAAIPGGGVLQVPCSYWYGNAKYVLRNSGAAGMTFNLNPGTLSTFEGYIVGAGTTSIINSIAPKRAIRVDVQGTVGQLASVEVYTQIDKV